MSDYDYTRNLRLINWLAALNNASFFVPFAVPFWLGAGLNQRSIYLLQSIFTLAAVVLEIPTGIFADRVGRKVSLVAGGILAASGFGIYSVAHSFWSFAIAEVVLAAGLSLDSGALQAMRHESAVAIGVNPRISAGKVAAARLLATAGCSMLGGLLVGAIGFRWAMRLDALTYAGATLCAILMVEPPRNLSQSSSATLRRAWPIIKPLWWLIAVFALLREITHIPVFLNARVFAGAGLSLAGFGFALAGLQLLGYLAARRGTMLEAKWGEQGTLLRLIAVGLGSYMLVGLLPAQYAPLGLAGFGLMYGVTMPLIEHALNSRVADDSLRATVNSSMALVTRLFYTAVGPVVGIVVDDVGVQPAFLTTGLGFAVLLAWPVYRSITILDRR